jgi:CMP-2-keto-3-deoxyoctulosonic acid synthetase
MSSIAPEKPVLASRWWPPMTLMSLHSVEAHGGKAVMTRADHPSGSDRIFEALQSLDPAGEVEIIVNVQGDLPTLDPTIIQKAAALMDNRSVDIATLATVIDNDTDKADPNVVKVVGTPIADRHLRALYFTRARAPHGEGDLFHHIGLYVYRRAALERFVSLPPSTLETREKLEQLRALEAGCALMLPSLMVYRWASIRRSIWTKPDGNYPQATCKEQRNKAVVRNAQSALRQTEI